MPDIKELQRSHTAGPRYFFWPTPPGGWRPAESGQHQRSLKSS